MALDPNIILAAGRGSQTPDLATLLQQRNAIKLSALAVQREQQGRDALDRVKADPTDMTALSDLAAVNPQAAQGYLAVQSAQRATAARGVAGKLVTAYAQPGMPGSPAPAPAVPAPGVNIDLPATGQSVQIPAKDRAADSPEASRAQSIQAVGQKAAETGDLDPAKAWGDLYSLDPDMGDKTLASIKGMDQLRVSRLAESHDALGKAAQSLLAVPDTPDHGQRIAAAMKILPQLAEHGVTQADVMNADLSDAGLHGIIGQGLTLQGAIEASQKDRQFGLESRKQNLEERKQTFEEHKPVAAGFGTTLVDPTTHQPVFDGSGGGASGVQFTGGWTPRARNGGDNPDPAVDAKISGAAQMLGVKPGEDISKIDPMKIARAMTFGEGGQGTLADRNNNPANLRNADGSYKKFASRAAGLQAAADLVSSKLRNGQTTVQTLIEGLPQENVIRAAAGLSAQALTDAADLMIKNGGKAPEGFARNAAQQAALRNAYSIRKAQQGLSTDQIVQEGQDTASQANALKLWNSGRPGTGAAVTRSISVAIDHLDQASKAAEALQNGNTPAFNSIANLISRETGKAPVTNFGAVKDFVTDEVTKAILAGNGGVGDREKASKILAGWNSPAQTSGVMDQLHGLMAGQLHGLAMQHKQTTGRDDFQRYISPRAQAVLSSYAAGGGLPVLTVEQARTAPSGTRFQTVDGRTMVKK